MKTIPTHQLLSELGEWPVNEVPAYIRVTDHSNLFFSVTAKKEGNYTLFARPFGFQLSLDYQDLHYPIPYSTISGVKLTGEVLFITVQGYYLLYSLLGGLLFYLAGNFFGGSGMALTWMPSGLVFGLLLSHFYPKQRPMLKLTFKVTDEDSFSFAIDLRKKEEVILFFSRLLNGKFENHV